MADKAITELDEATSVESSDLFVMQQGTTAKKLTGDTLGTWLEKLAVGLTISGQTTTYATSSSNTETPTSWSETVPTVTAGNYLWTRIVIHYSTGESSDPIYIVSRYGVDGKGSVNSVNGVSPDTSYNVTVTASDIAMSSSDSTKVADIIGDTALPTASTTLTGAIANIGNIVSDKTRIGTWIDGSPIYRAVVNGAFPSPITNGIVNVGYVTAESLNIKYPLRVYGYFINGDEYVGVPRIWRNGDYNVIANFGMAYASGSWVVEFETSRETLAGKSCVAVVEFVGNN